MLIGITDHIVIIALPGKSVRAHGITFPVVPQPLLLFRIVFQVLERNLFLLVDCLIDLVDDIENLIVPLSGLFFRLDPFFQRFTPVSACE